MSTTKAIVKVNPQVLLHTLGLPQEVSVVGIGRSGADLIFELEGPGLESPSGEVEMWFHTTEACHHAVFDRFNPVPK